MKYPFWQNPLHAYPKRGGYHKTGVESGFLAPKSGFFPKIGLKWDPQKGEIPLCRAFWLLLDPNLMILNHF